MDTILDFSLAKPSHATAFPANLNLANFNLENLNLSALTSLLLKSSTVPSSTLPTEIQQQLLTQPNPVNFIRDLGAALASTANLAPSCEPLLSSIANLNIPINGAIYSALSQSPQQNQYQQQHQQQQQQQQRAAHLISALAQSVAAANSPQKNHSNNDKILGFCENVTLCANEKEFEKKLIKPTAKRPKLANSPRANSVGSAALSAALEKIDAPVVPSLEYGKFTREMLSAATREATAASPRIGASSSLTCLAMSGNSPPPPPPPPSAMHSHSTAAVVASHQPPTPSRSSSIASSTASCVSSAQNSPSSASLRRHSSASASTFDKNGTPQRRAAAPIPENLKDDAYYERRKKNNDAAKRSRDSRRQKEEQTAQRAALLEQENMQLRTEVGLLKTEIKKLHALILTNGATNVKSRFRGELGMGQFDCGEHSNFDNSPLKSAFSPLFATNGSNVDEHYGRAVVPATVIRNEQNEEKCTEDDAYNGSSMCDDNNNGDSKSAPNILKSENPTKDFSVIVARCAGNDEMEVGDKVDTIPADSAPLMKLAMFDSEFADENDHN